MNTSHVFVTSCLAVVECLRSSGEVVVVGDHLPDGSLVAADVVLVGRIGTVAPLVRVVTEVDHLWID